MSRVSKIEFSPEFMERIARFNAAVGQAFIDLDKTIKRNRLRRVQKTPAWRDAVSSLRYCQAVQAERAKGHDFVKQYAAQARADLGLRPEHDPRLNNTVSRNTNERNAR